MSACLRAWSQLGGPEELGNDAALYDPRYDHARQSVLETLKTMPPNVWFELSLVRPFAMPGYGACVDESRLIFGTAAPRNDPVVEIEHFNANWPVAEHRGTYGENLRALLTEVRP